MVYKHFARGEAEDLVSYLDTGWVKRIVDSIRHNADIRDSVPIISDIDQGAAETRDYENRSSFGRNKRQIKRNARTHLRKCAYCRTEYELAVKGAACRFARMRIKTELLPIDKINELLEEDIKRQDVLGLLTQE